MPSSDTYLVLLDTAAQMIDLSCLGSHSTNRINQSITWVNRINQSITSRKQANRIKQSRSLV